MSKIEQVATMLHEISEEYNRQVDKELFEKMVNDEVTKENAYLNKLFKHPREERRAAKIKFSLKTKLQVTHIRIVPLDKSEIRLSNKQEKTFNTWEHMIRFIKFPKEFEPELLKMCLHNIGQWIEFVSGD